MLDFLLFPYFLFSCGVYVRFFCVVGAALFCGFFLTCIFYVTESLLPLSTEAHPAQKKNVASRVEKERERKGAISRKEWSDHYPLHLSSPSSRPFLKLEDERKKTRPCFYLLVVTITTCYCQSLCKPESLYCGEEHGTSSLFFSLLTCCLSL